MKWTSGLRLKPFSLDPGTCFLVPWTNIYLEVYPAKLLIRSFDTSITHSAIHFTFDSSVEKYFVEQNLEKGSLTIDCLMDKGRLVYEIHSEDGQLVLNVKRVSGDQKIQIDGKVISLAPKDHFSLTSQGEHLQKKELEHLSTGIFKKQDVYQISKRNDFSEWLTYLFLIGQQSQKGEGKTLKPLNDLDKMEQEKAFLKFIKIHLRSFMVPEVTDFLHYGAAFLDPSCLKTHVLYDAYLWIRNALFLEADDEIYILPKLFKSLKQGYLSNLQTKHGLWDIVWSKGEPLRLRFRAKIKGVISLKFPKGIKQSRVRRNHVKKGIDIFSSEEVSFLPNDLLVFDRFTK